MQSQNQVLFTIFITTVIVGAILFVWKKPAVSPACVNDSQESPSLVKYYCEQSGGTFDGNQCSCPSEFGEDLYDRTTGTCQTTIGGPGGNLGVAMNQTLDLQLRLQECLDSKIQ